LAEIKQSEQRQKENDKIETETSPRGKQIVSRQDWGNLDMSGGKSWLNGEKIEGNFQLLIKRSGKIGGEKKSNAFGYKMRPNQDICYLMRDIGKPYPLRVN